MDKLAAARAGLIFAEQWQEMFHRVPCSLCGMPCEPEKLTEASEDHVLCPECYEIYAASVRHYRARKRLKNRLEVMDYDAIRIV